MEDPDEAEDRYAAVIDPESEGRMVFVTDRYYLGYAIHAIAAAAAEEPLPERTMAHMPQEWVYFVQAGDQGPIKIGYSKNPVGRFVSLQTGSPVKHHYLGNVPGNRGTERDLHARFWGTHVHGEWFEPTPELLEYIEVNRFRSDTDWDPAEETVQLF